MNKKFSKLMLTSASALALLAAYPSIASTSEAVGVELPSITAEAATQGNAFIRVVRALPSVANITSADAASVRAARNLYNSLPAAEKANAGVARWAGYLAEKEAALPVDHVANFLIESRVLPNVAEINAMNATDFAKAKSDLQAARFSYSNLTAAQKADANVARWAGYLTVKEDAFGVTFILAAKDLPTVGAIEAMDADELEALAEDIASVQELFNALSPTAKADAEVARWMGYVNQKAEAAEVEEVVELAIDSVSAIGVKKLEVKFNTATDSANLTVRKGSVAVNIDNIEIAEDGESAVITTTANLTRGDYTVVLGNSNYTVTVENPRVAAINVLSETAPLNSVSKTLGSVDYAANETADVRYEVLNQYGEKMSNQTITWTQSTGGPVFAKDGVLTIANTANKGVPFIPGNKVFLTGVHGTTATVVNAEVTIGLASRVAEVEFAGIYDTTTSKVVDLPADFANDRYVLLFEAQDQYGNKVIAERSELTLLSNNPLFVAQPTELGSVVTIDGVDYQTIKLAHGTQPKQGGTATIQVISNNTGKTASYTVNADALSEITNFSMTAPDQLIAGNDTAVEVPFTAVDQYGNAVTRFADLNGKVTFSSSSGDLEFERQQDGSAKLIYKPESNTLATDRIVTLTSLVQRGGSYSNIQLSVKQDARPEAVLGLNSNVSTSIATENNVKFKAEDISLQDQYGRIWTKAQVNNWVNSDNNAIVITSDDNADVIITSAAGTDGLVYVSNSTDEFTISATAAQGSNTERLVISLSTEASTPNEESIISSSSRAVTFTRVAQSEYASYEVADFGPMYNDATGTATGDAYNVAPKVYGVTAAGARVLLPASQYTITLNTNKLVANNGVITEAGTSFNDEDFIDTATQQPKNVTVKVTILVKDSTGAAAATFERDLIVTNAQPVATTLKLSDDVVNGRAFVTTTDGTISRDDLIAFVAETKDQYGAVNNTFAPTVTISNVTKVEGSDFTVNENAEDNLSIDDAQSGDAFTATLKYAGGKTETINFVVDRTTPSDEEVALIAATDAVGTAETEKTDATRTTAQDLVTALPEGAEKTALQDRLDAIVTAEDDQALIDAAEQALIDAAAQAKDYTYDPVYSYNYESFDVSGNEATLTYDLSEVTTSPEILMNDLARYLGALYRVDDGATVESIDYSGANYVWDGDLKGSNWKTGGILSLVSVITSQYTDNPGSFDTITITLNDTDNNSVDLTLKFIGE